MKPAWMCNYDGCRVHKHVSNGGQRRAFCTFHLAVVDGEKRRAKRQAEGREPLRLVLVNPLTGEGECIQTVTAVHRKPLVLPDNAEAYTRLIRQYEADGYQVAITALMPELEADDTLDDTEEAYVDD